MYIDHSGLFRSMRILRTAMKELESNELSNQFLLLKTYNSSLISQFLESLINDKEFKYLLYPNVLVKIFTTNPDNKNAFKI